MNTRVDIRRNDTVKVMSGSGKGKEGRVLRVIPGKGKLLVEHVRMVKKHVRPDPNHNIKGGIAEQEAPVSISAVALICAACGPTLRSTGWPSILLPRCSRHVASASIRPACIW